MQNKVKHFKRSISLPASIIYALCILVEGGKQSIYQWCKLESSTASCNFFNTWFVGFKREKKKTCNNNNKAYGFAQADVVLIKKSVKNLTLSWQELPADAGNSSQKRSTSWENALQLVWRLRNLSNHTTGFSSSDAEVFNFHLEVIPSISVPRMPSCSNQPHPPLCHTTIMYTYEHSPADVSRCK